MADFNTKVIRNVCLLGHGGSGKTSLAEAMLYSAKACDRLGKVPEGNTVCDYDAEEIKRGFSVGLSIASFPWNTVKINLLDTPGTLDFEGEVRSGIRAADAAVIVIDGKSGVEVGAELAWDLATEAKVPRAFFINKYDDAEASFERVFNALRDRFGIQLCPALVPVKRNGKFELIDLVSMKLYNFDEKGTRSEAELTEEYIKIADKYKDALNEAIAGTNDELMEKYFAGEEISTEESTLALHEGIISGDIVPVYCGSAAKLWGIRALLDAIEGSFPRHTAKKNETVIENGEEKPYPIDPEGECSVFVFKTVSDQFGKQTYFKVMSGTLRRDMTLKNSASGSEEKMAHFYSPCGKKQTEYEVMHAGDIGVISKLGRTATNDTLSQSGTLTFRKIDFPEPYMAKSVVASGKGDEDKIAASILKLTDEDPTLKFENNAETKQMLIYGMGDMQLDVAVSRLKSRYGVTVQTGEPEIAYRETIKKRVQVEGKHKKQSGGSGQYGHVKITFSPGEAERLTFTQSVVGGNVPKGYYPAVEKGLLEAMQEGVLAGYPVVNLAADLYDGSYHPVDSNEISFKLAARLAYKEGLPKADPILLEPVGKLNVTVPDALVGDVIGDLNKRRGRVLGMNPAEGKSGFTVVEADVPKSEMTDYVIALRAMSQGRARFTFKVERYEEVPSNIAQKIIAARAK